MKTYFLPEKTRISEPRYYLRSIRIFFSWLLTEGIIEESPFDPGRIPRPPTKVIPTFTESQIRSLLGVIDTAPPRDSET